MASKAAIAKNNKRAELNSKLAEKRMELIAKRDYAALLKLPRNSSKTRFRNRCEVTGRPRGYFRLFGMSRIALRQAGMKGEVPGLRKYSW